MKKIWITWEHHRRTTELSAALGGVKLYELQLDAVRPIRYTWLLFQSLLVLMREKPELLFVQNPSIVLSLFSTTLGRMLAKQIVVDAHNEGLRPFHDRYKGLLPLYRLIQRRADLVIVTNEKLAAGVSSNGGQAFVLPDRVPRFRQPRMISLQGRINIVFICTFEKDEPFREVIESAKLVGEDAHIYITGRYEKAPADLIKNAVSNVTFTGFLGEQDYVDLLFSCHAVMDLTFMEDCLVCGAYEAISLEKPMILSDTRALRRFFHTGAIYTANDPISIAIAIRRVADIGMQKRLKTEVHNLKKKLIKDWLSRFQALQEKLQS